MFGIYGCVLQVLADGRWLELSPGYPEVESTSAEIINIIIQIPSYTNTLTYSLLFVPDKHPAEVRTTTTAPTTTPPIRYTTLAEDGAAYHYGDIYDYSEDDSGRNKVVRHRQEGGHDPEVGGQQSQKPTSGSAVMCPFSTSILILIAVSFVLFL